MPTVRSVGATGNPYIDGVLSGDAWAVSSLSFSFPSSAFFYSPGYGAGEPSRNFEPLNNTQQNAVRAAFQMYALVANISFAEISENSSQHADLRFAMSDQPSTAWAYYPYIGSEGGDSWYNNSSGNYDNPVRGNYDNATFIHEIGHALGLKHPHETDTFGAVPINRDSMEYSIMSYRAYVGASMSGGYTNEDWSFAQTPMMYDIAALQHMYGANYSANSGNTVYSWSPVSGEILINGIGQGAPGANRIFMTVWDGGGKDTYDLSNYSADVIIDLRPGEWSTASAEQLARLAETKIATGNVANALLYEGDLRSIIENAVGGSGNDTIRGNQVANLLQGGIGNDSLFGFEADDTLEGGSGDDLLDGGVGTDIVLYGGVKSIYLFVDLGSGVVKISDTRGATADGMDIISNTEFFRFADVSLSYDELFPVIPGNILTGTVQDDVLIGTNGNDDISGGDGNDRLYGQVGQDLIFGGLGTDHIEGNEGADRLYGNGGNDYMDGGAGADVMDGGSGNELMLGGADNDQMYGGDGNDFLYGGTGNDILVGAEGRDTLVGEEGDDYLYMGSNGGLGDGGTGNDVGVGSTMNDVFNLGSENDTAFGYQGQDYFYAGIGNDAMYGGAGVDVLLGEAGNDYFDGGEDVNYYFGGSGVDTFVVRDIPSVQVVQDWVSRTDKVYFQGSAFTSLADVLSHSFQNGAYFVISVDSDTAVWLNGASAGSVTAADFIFG